MFQTRQVLSPIFSIHTSIKKEKDHINLTCKTLSDIKSKFFSYHFIKIKYLLVTVKESDIINKFNHKILIQYFTLKRLQESYNNIYYTPFIEHF